MKTALLSTLPLVCAATFAPGLRAEVKPSKLFADHMVLQQQMDVPVWGTAKAGESVAVDFAGQHVATTAAPDGKWLVKLRPLTASATPQTFTITGTNTLTFSDVLVGEVWVCSGQSNMERALGLAGGQKPIDRWEQEQTEATHPLIRQYKVRRQASAEPQTELPGGGSWVVCSPETVKDFTAVGYFFGRDLSGVLNVPVGLIHSSWGGTQAEAWTPHRVFENSPDLRSILDTQAKAVAEFPERLAKFKADEPALLQKYEADATQAAAQGKPAPRKPAPPGDPRASASAPSVLYNGMIAPLEPCAIRGVIWYQGESNVGRAKQYLPLFSALITDWRKAWNEGPFPFLFVQLAPFGRNEPELREAQRLTWRQTPNTAMTVITDSGDAADIHPPHKQAVGARLALAAEALAYGRKIEWSGPAYDAMKTDGNAVDLSFTHVGGGLVAKDGDLKGFTVAGADGKFVPATAEIRGDHVRVSSGQVSAPVAVRFGWAAVPDVNFFNKEGLPASPFQTGQ